MKRTVLIECQSCGGRGLYKGFAERGKCAVVCDCCKGTGSTEYTYDDEIGELPSEYTEFEGRNKMMGVTRVFQSGCGYIQSDEDFVKPDGSTIHFSQYGCSYEEWEQGATPTPMEELYCPHIYSSYTGIGEATCSRCKEGCAGGVGASRCAFFSDKAKCWEEWHKNNK